MPRLSLIQQAHDREVVSSEQVCDKCRPDSNFATIRAAQMAAAASTNTTIVVNFDLGTLNSASARIHSPRKFPLAERLHRHLSKLIYGDTAAFAAGPTLLSASASTTSSGDRDRDRDRDSVVTMRFAGNGAGGLHLHGTAGCIGGYDFSAGKKVSLSLPPSLSRARAVTLPVTLSDSLSLSGRANCRFPLLRHFPVFLALWW